MIPRRKTVVARVGNQHIGSSWPIIVQSMTNTDTADVDSTVRQVLALVEAGSEMVRLTVNTPEAAAAVAKIRQQLDREGVSVPLIGDFHYNGHQLLKQYSECARSLDKYRINPGNVGMGRQHDTNFARMIEVACENRKPIRIGVNWGSLDQQLLARLMDDNRQQREPLDVAGITRKAMVASALESAQFAEACGLEHHRIILSAKVSGVQDLIAVYRDLASQCDYPLHIGLTEAGLGSRGIIASTAAVAVLLQDGIGDTLRISLTPEPGGERTEEVRVAKQILQSMGLRSFSPQVTACPGCGRTTSTLFQEIAARIQEHIQRQMPKWKGCYKGIEELRVAVMGCVVNGPGESRHAHIGISLPGTGEEPKGPVYADGQLLTTLKGPNLVADFIRLLDQYVDSHYKK